MNLTKLRQAAEAIARCAIRAVDPGALIRQAVKLSGNRLTIGENSVDLDRFKRILVVGAGKAGAPMAGALEEILGDRITGGAVVVKDGHAKPLRRIRVFEARHPVPDRRGLHAARAIVSLLEQYARADTLALCVISGGGSALMPLPRDPVSLQDKQQTTSLLLRCGASIDETNAVRKHISKIKGGQLARAAGPARLECLILSDVVGDKLDTIASGPAVGDPSTFSDCREILDRYKIWQTAPQSVRETIERGVRGEIHETPKPGSRVFGNVRNVIIGNNRTALEAASAEASSLGFHPLILSACISGEAKDVGTVLASIALEVVASSNPAPPPLCIIAGGETTVTVRGTGKGGRNQELALSASLKLTSASDIVVAGVGTDGTDGPTDAAGAIVDVTTVERARTQGLDPVDYLNRNDSYNLLQAIGDLLITGPTGTNVMDLLIALVASPKNPPPLAQPRN